MVVRVWLSGACGDETSVRDEMRVRYPSGRSSRERGVVECGVSVCRYRVNCQLIYSIHASVRSRHTQSAQQQHDIALASTATVQRQRHAARAHSKNQSLLTTPGRARKPQAHRLDTHSLRKPRATLCCSTHARAHLVQAREMSSAQRNSPQAHQLQRTPGTLPIPSSTPRPPQTLHALASQVKTQRAASPPGLRATSHIFDHTLSRPISAVITLPF